jgi:hypothetical protein
VVKTEARSLSPERPPKVRVGTVAFRPAVAEPTILPVVSKGLFNSALLLARVSVPAEMMVEPV